MRRSMTGSFSVALVSVRRAARPLGCHGARDCARLGFRGDFRPRYPARRRRDRRPRARRLAGRGGRRPAARGARRGARGPRAQGRRRPRRPRAADGAARRAPARRRRPVRGGRRTTRRRLDADRVWIVDPLDGTREFSEPPRDDWAVHVALWEGGDADRRRGRPARARRDVQHRPARPSYPLARRSGRGSRSRRSRPPAFVARRSPRSSTPSWCRWARPASR